MSADEENGQIGTLLPRLFGQVQPIVARHGDIRNQKPKRARRLGFPDGIERVQRRHAMAQKSAISGAGRIPHTPYRNTYVTIKSR